MNLAYVLKNDQGKVLDQADVNTPLSYLHGAHQIVSGLESALVGMKKGQKKKVSVVPKDAYGEINPDLKIQVTRSHFPPGSNIQEGSQFRMKTPDGGSVVFSVVSVKGDDVFLNGNHPMAGETLHFDIEIVEVRDATAEEKSHGHAHGSNGHDH